MAIQSAGDVDGEMKAGKKNVVSKGARFKSSSVAKALKKKPPAQDYSGEEEAAMTKGGYTKGGGGIGS